MRLSNAKTKDKITANPYMFIYGAPGSGKTYLAKTLLDDKDLLPALVLVCDNSEITLKNYICSDLEVHSANLDICTEAYNLINSKQNEYKSLFIDSLSNLHRMCMQDEAKKNVKVDARRDYGTVRAQILTMLDAFILKLAKPIPFIVTCWSQYDLDESTGRKTILPNLPGKLVDEVCGMFPVAGYLYTKEPTSLELKQARETKEPYISQRILQTMPTREVPIAKSPNNCLGIELANPTIPGIKQLLNG